MEIVILAQDRMSLCGYHSIEEVRESDGWRLYGMPGRRLLGSFRKSTRAEKVMLDILAAYNHKPQAILVIPEDDDDILNPDNSCRVKFSMNERDCG